MADDLRTEKMKSLLEKFDDNGQLKIFRGLFSLASKLAKTRVAHCDIKPHNLMSTVALDQITTAQ